jgi:hypothetical protein
MKTLIILIALLFAATSALAETDVTLAWDANTEPDLAGYKVHRGIQAGIYDTIFDVPLDTLTNPLSPIYVDESLPDGTYFWTVTAYDTDSNESGYSTEVSKKIDTIPPSVPIGVRIEITVKVIIE